MTCESDNHCMECSLLLYYSTLVPIHIRIWAQMYIYMYTPALRHCAHATVRSRSTDALSHQQSLALTNLLKPP